MSSYSFLENIKSPIKERLVEEFGSLENLYNLICKIENRELEYSYKEDTERLYHNRYERYKIEKRMEQLGVANAIEITWEVAQECKEKTRKEYLL